MIVQLGKKCIEGDSLCKLDIKGNNKKERE